MKARSFSSMLRNMEMALRPENVSQINGLVSGLAGGDDGVEGLKQGHAVGLTLLPLRSSPGESGVVSL